MTIEPFGLPFWLTWQNTSIHKFSFDASSVGAGILAGSSFAAGSADGADFFSSPHAANAKQQLKLTTNTRRFIADLLNVSKIGPRY